MLRALDLILTVLAFALCVGIAILPQARWDEAALVRASAAAPLGATTWMSTATSSTAWMYWTSSASRTSRGARSFTGRMVVHVGVR